ncbi:E3 SUMO-protein ligase ZBED1-like [Misgurnus anguillicaudatus]|uniref:E3 SUMO-protein ligase ZBED1-like n=1 Tax=Misgurnus anguillicaudatus TaxID=75329 RepID=UPI003CCFC0C6
MASSKNKRSGVWNYFDQNDQHVVCKICQIELSYHNSTSTMRSHMKSKHQTVNIDQSTEERQLPITAFTTAGNVRPMCTPERAEKTTNLISKMIARDMLPLSFVKGDGFKEVLHFLEPDYNPPSRKTITARIELQYECKVSELKTTLGKVEFVAITTDSWTSLTTESYVTITCHFIADSKVKSYVLQTRALEERHSAANLAEHLKTSVEQWGLAGKVVACVHDNASNIVAANRDVDWESLSCFAHTLQLAINDGFKAASINRLIGACSKLVGHFHHSTIASNALKQKQRQLELPSHKLMQYCKTRWNSAADMLARLHEQRWAITAVLSDRTTTKLADAKTLELIDDHWQTIEEILPVLQTLKIATEALGGENYVSVSMVYPLVHSLLSRHLQVSGEESQKVNEFKNTVAASLKQRVHNANLQNAGKTPLLASALDPRHKHLRFLDENMRVSVREKLFEQYQSISSDVMGAGGAVAAAAADEEDEPVPSHRRRLSLFFGEDYSESSRDEWEQFLTEPCIPPDEDPINWWKDNTKRFKKLGHLAHRYLCVPATSVPAERVFSAAGLIVNRLRCRLSPEHVDMLVFLNKNM